VGLYLDSPDKALVLAVDGQSQIQALDWTKPPARSDTLAAYGRRINDSDISCGLSEMLEVVFRRPTVNLDRPKPSKIDRYYCDSVAAGLGYARSDNPQTLRSVIPGLRTVITFAVGAISDGRAL